MMSRHIPREITTGIKQGFSAPDASWFRGESIRFVEDRLRGSRVHLYRFLDSGTVKQLIDEHVSGKKNHRLLIWSLLSVEEWIRSSAGLGWV